ncbi:MAG: hypothetical protein EXR33_04185 [Betaproteobacteria bacterium]|nr:hypothetical protein [Betaproteobacteria bacterium]
MELKPDMERAQHVFAQWLDAGTKIGFVLLVISFALYLSGLLPPQVPLAELPKLWGLPLAKFVATAGAPTGWQWLALASCGDYFNYFGIVLLASIVMAAYLRVLPLLAQHDRNFAIIAALEIVVLLAAASGLLNSFGGGSP